MVILVGCEESQAYVLSFVNVGMKHIAVILNHVPGGGKNND